MCEIIVNIAGLCYVRRCERLRRMAREMPVNIQPLRDVFICMSCVSWLVMCYVGAYLCPDDQDVLHLLPRPPHDHFIRQSQQDNKLS